MLSSIENSALLVFREFLSTPGEMLCFTGPNWEKHQAGLRRLAEKDLLTKERFKGAYSLTRSGFTAMKAAMRAEAATAE